MIVVHPDRYSTSNVIQPKRLIVVHTSESGDGSLQTLLTFMERPGDRTIPGSNPPRLFGAAYHALADGTTGNYVQVLPGSIAPYSNGGANKFSWSICCPGRAAQTRDEWLDPMSRGQIKAVARFIVDRAKVDGIPLKRLTPEQIVAGESGYCGHVDVTYAYRKSTHTDPGPNFPWDVLAADIAALTAPKPPITPPKPPITPPNPNEDEDDMIDVTPHARVLDTRKTKNPLAAGEVRKVAVSMGGSAALFRLTTIGTGAGGGYLQVSTTPTFGETSECAIGPNVAESSLCRSALVDNGFIYVKPTHACHLIVDTQAVKP